MGLGLRVHWSDPEERQWLRRWRQQPRSTWQKLAASLSRSPRPGCWMEYLHLRQACSSSLTRAWSFCHGIRFPCGIFLSTFCSFKKSDNTGRERHLEPRSRIKFLMKIATLQEPLFPIVFHASLPQTTSQRWGGGGGGLRGQQIGAHANT